MNTVRVMQVICKPDRTWHVKAVACKRNDRLVQAMPIGVAVFPNFDIT